MKWNENAGLIIVTVSTVVFVCCIIALLFRFLLCWHGYSMPLLSCVWRMQYMHFLCTDFFTCGYGFDSQFSLLLCSKWPWISFVGWYPLAATEDTIDVGFSTHIVVTNTAYEGLTSYQFIVTKSLITGVSRLAVQLTCQLCCAIFGSHIFYI